MFTILIKTKAIYNILLIGCWIHHDVRWWYNYSIANWIAHPVTTQISRFSCCLLPANSITSPRISRVRPKINEELHLNLFKEFHQKLIKFVNLKKYRNSVRIQCKIFVPSFPPCNFFKHLLKGIRRNFEYSNFAIIT